MTQDTYRFIVALLFAVWVGMALQRWLDADDLDCIAEPVCESMDEPARVAERVIRT